MMRDLTRAVVELFAEAAALPEHRRYSWPLYLPRRARPRTQRELYRAHVAREKAQRRRERAMRISYRIEPLPYLLCCRFCRQGIHHEFAHYSNCRSMPASAGGRWAA